MHPIYSCREPESAVSFSLALFRPFSLSQSSPWTPKVSPTLTKVCEFGSLKNASAGGIDPTQQSSVSNLDPRILSRTSFRVAGFARIRSARQSREVCRIQLHFQPEFLALTKRQNNRAQFWPQITLPLEESGPQPNGTHFRFPGARTRQNLLPSPKIGRAKFPLGSNSIRIFGEKGVGG